MLNNSRLMGTTMMNQSLLSNNNWRAMDNQQNTSLISGGSGGFHKKASSVGNTLPPAVSQSTGELRPLNQDELDKQSHFIVQSLSNLR